MKEEVTAQEPGDDIIMFSGCWAVLHSFLLLCRSSAIHEEAMLAVGSLTFAIGRPFVKYMDRFYPFMEIGLRNHKEWQVGHVTVLEWWWYSDALS